ncbi:related to polyketide synthase [Rhynchosporium secalis]|uniref:Related to polyketide synthase n=1 Tax=Rhynchosporium secalis TaxID=38038 RepID=A0A1E1M3B2_RHYSE|nr:related to polyketide synthase [Rhynchosporium secalis]
MVEPGEDACMPIAVIGMACRFPGDATSPDKLWEMLANGRNAWSEFPKDRINIDGFYHPSGNREGSICFKGGHFLKENVAAWDAPFFSTTAHEAAAMDPQQRILLEVSYEAFENAGIPIETLPGTSTAVYCGSFVKDYEQICLRDPDFSPQYAATGNGIAIMSNRISWFYDLRGPSMTLDTGCSASLVGVHLACQSLRTGESTIAIAMGAGMILTPSTMLPMTALNFLSPDGKCFAFDERANGYGRGEGIGGIVLKPLADALRDNDTIRAVIRGSGVNQDGRTPGITMPSKEAQALNIRAVYKTAGLGYNRTAYFEAHGTGTQAGDPTELGAISATFPETRDSKNPIYVGSVKTNIGHLEGCAGIAGIVKGVLMLEKGLIPPNLYFENVNPKVDLDSWHIKIPQSVTPWPMEGLRRVSINCFGFGGTNAHIILDDASNYLSERGIEGNHNSVEMTDIASPYTMDSGVIIDTAPSALGESHPVTNAVKAKLYILTCHEQSGIEKLSRGYSDYLAANDASIDSKAATQLATDLAYTLACRRTRLPWKAFIVSSSPDRLGNQLVEGISKPVRSSEAPTVAFIFSGQGAQWFAMGRELLQYEVFRDSLEEADTYLQSIGSKWSLMAEYLKDGTESIINLPKISQPLCTALQIALVELLASWNVKPSAVLGHSSGEIAAAYALGALSKADSWKLAYHRGRLTSNIALLSPNNCGRMMAVGLSKEAAEVFIREIQNGVAIVACVNSPENVTISGDESAVLELEERLQKEPVFARKLKIEIAYHSAHMRVIEKPYSEAISDIQILEVPAGNTMFSSVTGASVQGEQLGPAYWVQNLVSPVQFSEAAQSLLRAKSVKADVLIEIGPHGVLKGPLKQIMDGERKPKARPKYISMLTREKDAVATSLEMAGTLFTLGHLLDLGKVNTSISDTSPRVLSNLPTYPWNHTKTYWHESHIGAAHRFRKFGRMDLIGSPSADATPFEPRWRGFIRVSENPWVLDHQVQNTIIYPAAGMISMALEAAQQIQEPDRKVDGYEIAKMNILKAMIIPETIHGLETAINVKINEPVSKDEVAWFEFVIYSKLLGATWVKNADGVLCIRYKSRKTDVASNEDYRLVYEEAKATCNEVMSARQLYETLESIGMKYGPMFQNIVAISKKDKLSCTIVRIPDTKSRMPAKYEYPHLVHPATLDAMFQTVFVAGAEPMVPSFLQSLFISADFPRGAGKYLRGYSSASREGLRDATGTIVMADASWRKPLIIVKDLHFMALSSNQEDFKESDFIPNHHKLCVELEWKYNVDTTAAGSLSEWIRLLTFKHPDLNILEICYDGEPLIESIFGVLSDNPSSTPRMSKYTLATNASGISEDIQSRLGKTSAYVVFKGLTGPGDLEKQVLKARTFDLVISNVKGPKFLPTLRGLLKSKGRLVLLQALENQTVSKDIVSYHATQYASIESCNLQSLIASSASGERGNTNRAYILGNSSASSMTIMPREFLIIIPDKPSQDVQTLCSRLAEALLVLGAKATTSVLVHSPEQFPQKICISLLEIEAPSIFNWTNKEFDAFRSLVSLSAGCLWVTKGGHVEVETPFMSPAATLLRTIRSEDPQKMLFSLDLDPHTGMDIESTGATILNIISDSFDPTAVSQETEYAERDGKLLIPRAVLQEQLSSKIERGNTQRPPITLPFLDVKRPLQIEVRSLGDLDSLCFVDDHVPTLELVPYGIEIKVKSVGVNTTDVETAMGQNSCEYFGSDVSGIVSQAGTATTRFKLGDRVAAIAQGAFKTFVRCSESMVQHIPDDMTFEVAASLPSDLVAAYYAANVGRLQGGELVLIHAGASGFGQAFIQIAQHLGAEVYATIEALKERKHLMLTYRIPEDHILDMNSIHFGKSIHQLTSGRGVDLIINTIGRRHLEETWKCMNDLGRFVDMRNSHTSHPTTLDSLSTLRNATYAAIDILHIFQTNLATSARLFQSAFDLVRGKFVRESRPINVLPLSDISAAFQDTQKRTHGNVVVNISDSDLVRVVPRDSHPLQLSPDATYVLVGGLGGLGRSLAVFMVKHGARHLAFLSRSGAVSERQKDFMARLAADDVDAKAYACDICDKSQLVEVLQRCALEMPNIRGVVQGAAVLRDAIFDNMTYEDWVAVTRPKMQGSWNLHESMPTDLDFFILLSSSAGAIGARGQANYNSGNAFQDALAHYRRNKGMAGVSLDLGPILGAGMVAEDESTLEMLRAAGFFGIREKDFHIIVSAAMTGYTEDDHRTPAQLITGTGTGGGVKQNNVGDPYWYNEARFSIMAKVGLVPSSTDSDTLSMQELLSSSTSISEAASTILEGLITLFAKSMNMLPGDLDTRKSASAYGVDSLVAVGTRNWIFRETGVDVSIFQILSENTIAEMADDIAKKCKYLSVEIRASEDDE